MRKFKLSHPDYDAYASQHYCVNQVPEGLPSAVEGLIIKDCPGDSHLKHVVNAILTCIPEGPTSNWGWNYLANDLSSAIARVARKPFHKFMDAVGFAFDALQQTDFPAELEEVLEELKFGYYVETKDSEPYWALRDENTDIVAAEIEETEVEVKDVCDQAVEHLEQAKANLKKGDERARKDAVRDAMSAMEALYKSLSGKGDIKDACAELRRQKSWGPDLAVKEGLTIWNHLHHEYPDIRHGQAASSSLSEEDAQFWIERIGTFIRYMSRRRKKQGRSDF